jgi:SAM-dependent methyltransferase
MAVGGSAAESFGGYAAVYDLVYRDKDYPAECDFLERAWRMWSERPVATVLDLGAGTGNHAVELARRGYGMTAVDRSPAMLAEAARKGGGVELVEGDVRSIDLGRTFDAVVELFAVLGYQTTDEDVGGALATVARHLEPGGTFVADLWWAPAVLGPEQRRVELRDGDDVVERTVTPTHDRAARVVEIEIVTRRLRGGSSEPLAGEHHRVRYFDGAELDSLLACAGLELVELCPFLQPGREPTAEDWSVSLVARRR